MEGIGNRKMAKKELFEWTGGWDRIVRAASIAGAHRALRKTITLESLRKVMVGKPIHYECPRCHKWQGIGSPPPYSVWVWENKKGREMFSYHLYKKVWYIDVDGKMKYKWEVV